MCRVDKPFIYADNFEVLSGEQYFVNGEISFPDDFESGAIRGSYRSVFGPTFNHSGVMYAVNNNNTRLAMRRLTAKRKPELPGEHESLFQLQDQFITDHLASLTTILKRNIGVFADYDTVEIEVDRRVTDPHPKRNMRIRALNDSLETGAYYGSTWCRANAKGDEYVIYKMKPDEWAKPEKYGRMIGDMDVLASLVGSHFAKLIKIAQSGFDDEPLVINGVEIIVASSPDVKILTKIFERIISPVDRGTYAIFSDDAVYSCRVGSEVLMYNIDIASCDGSHGPRVFELLREYLPAHLHKDFNRALDQLRLPIRIYECNNRKSKSQRRFVTLRPKQRMLYSGSTLTTCVNSMASTIIAYAIAIRAANTVDEIQAAARMCGYSVTVDVCLKPQHVQFLKCSPVLTTDGRWVPCPNFGVLLRSSGICRGDLPGRGSIFDRARTFHGSVLNGIYTHLRVPAIDAHRIAFPSSAVERILFHDVSPVGSVSDTEFLERYDFDASDIAAFQVQFVEAKTFTHTTSSWASKVLAKDYGL